MPTLFPGRAPRQCTLDYWLGLAELKRRRSKTVEGLIKAERDARWLARH